MEYIYIIDTESKMVAAGVGMGVEEMSELLLLSLKIVW